MPRYHAAKRTSALMALMLTSACQEQIADVPYIAALTEPKIVRAEDANAPPNARPGSCWGRDVTPAVLETVSEQVLVQPAEVMDDGTVITPGIFHTETQQRIVRERREIWFETPCEEVWTEEFTASLQRALKVRGLFYGSPTGQLDGRTRAAIRRYQSAGELDSVILSLESARRLGLVAVARE